MSKLLATEHNSDCKHPNVVGSAWHHRQILNPTKVRCLDCQHTYTIPFYLQEIV